MKQVGFCNEFKLTAMVIGVVVLTTPQIPCAAGVEAAPLDSSNWLCRVGRHRPPGGEDPSPHYRTC